MRHGLLRSLSVVSMAIVGASAMLGCIAEGQTIRRIDPLGSTHTIPEAINDAGQIAGFYIDSAGLHGFLRQEDGRIVSFDGSSPNPGPVSTVPTSINAKGEIAGYLLFVGFTQHSFVRQANGKITVFRVDPPQSAMSRALSQAEPGGCRSAMAGDVATGIDRQGRIIGVFGNVVCTSYLRQRDGTIIQFGMPSDGIPNTQAQAINSQGQITGYYYDRNNNHGFLRQTDGTNVTFDAPASDSTYPTAINDSGLITGYAGSFGSGGLGFLRRADGTVTTFDINGFNTRPHAVNSVGQITGSYLDADGTSHGFLRQQDGTITTFDAPEAGSGAGKGTFPQAINKAGQITGYYQDANGIVHGFLRSR
jgi:hypothetical protein